MTDVTTDILARFRWVDGHADVWRLFSHPGFFPALVQALADPFRASSITVTPPDYRNEQLELRLQRESLTQGDRVVIVDDWFETGNQALAAKSLIEAAGARFVGASVIVDQLDPGVRLRLAQFHALIQRDALGDDS
jgi:adenine phosphoribosyltransferase